MTKMEKIKKLRKVAYYTLSGAKYIVENDELPAVLHTLLNALDTARNLYFLSPDVQKDIRNEEFENNLEVKTKEIQDFLDKISAVGWRWGN